MPSTSLIVTIIGMAVTINTTAVKSDTACSNVINGSRISNVVTLLNMCTAPFITGGWCFVRFMMLTRFPLDSVDETSTGTFSICFASFVFLGQFKPSPLATWPQKNLNVRRYRGGGGVRSSETINSSNIDVFFQYAVHSLNVVLYAFDERHYTLL